MTERYVSLSVMALEADPGQPRVEMESPDDGNLTEAHTLWGLAQSIGEVGILQPIRVRPVPGREGRYRIISGQRRFEAAKLAGLHEIPCIVDEDPGDEARVLLSQVSENLQRKAFTANELALAIAGLQKDGATREAIAKKLGIQPSQVTLLLSLLVLTEPVKKAFDRGLVESPRAAYDLNKLPEALQEKMVREAELRGQILTQRDARDARMAYLERMGGKLHRFEAPVLTRAEFVALRAVLDAEAAGDNYAPEQDRDVVFGRDWRTMGSVPMETLQQGVPVIAARVRVPSVQLTQEQATCLLDWLQARVPADGTPNQGTNDLGKMIAALLVRL